MYLQGGLYAINWPRLQCKGSKEVKTFVLTSVVILVPQGLNQSYSYLCRDNPIFCLLFCNAGHAKRLNVPYLYDAIIAVLNRNAAVIFPKK